MQPGMMWRALGHRVLDLFYPPHCALCFRAASRGEHLCGACLRSAPRVTAPACPVCSLPMETAGECVDCRLGRPAFQCAVSLYRSHGVVREVIHRFKYQRHYEMRHPLAAWLRECLDDPRLASPAPQALVPVPLHPARERERGFNQARVLAQALSRYSGIPLRDALRRTRPTPSQTRLDRADRMENLRNAFELAHNACVRNQHLLLLDDVLTTGSTVHECARVLLKAGGAASVRVATVARG